MTLTFVAETVKKVQNKDIACWVSIIILLYVYDHHNHKNYYVNADQINEIKLDLMSLLEIFFFIIIICNSQQSVIMWLA